MVDTILIYTTAPSREVADALAASLIDKCLCACVNMFDGMRSVYRWEGKVESATEVAMIIKTVAAHTDAIKALIAEEHPYDNPACLVLEVKDGLPDFLDWIARETA
jgi:periplasmic divalent cation tolerance protein